MRRSAAARDDVASRAGAQSALTMRDSLGALALIRDKTLSPTRLLSLPTRNSLLTALCQRVRPRRRRVPCLRRARWARADAVQWAGEDGSDWVHRPV